MRTSRTRSVSGIGALSAACVTGTLLAVTLLAATPAQADSIKFFSGSNGYSGPFNGVGTSVYDSIKGLSTACPGGGTGCSGNPDVISTPQTYDGGITASANIGGVWNDLSPNFAGLGVGPLNGNPSDADQIEGTEILTIKFSSNVNLTGVATLFAGATDGSGHTPFGPGFSNNTFVGPLNTFLLNGVVTTFGAANLALFGLFDDEFTFQANRRTADVLRWRADLDHRTVH